MESKYYLRNKRKRKEEKTKEEPIKEEIKTIKITNFYDNIIQSKINMKNI